jgi:hypothetical protein
MVKPEARTTTDKQNGRTRPKRDLRAMQRAARDGDCSAARALLRLYGFDEIARQVNTPYSNRVRTAIDALTAGVDTEWEPDMIDLPPRRSKALRIDLFDD